MMFPQNWEKFVEDYSFVDSEEFYTNGSTLIPTFRVEQMIEHYFGSRWIPVSERLPFAEYGESEDVLTVSELGVIRVLYFDGGCWCYQTGECCQHKVTHWMPLPNPPEEV
jgi:hypothetical protein